jgi:hypothetical protein
MFRVWAHGPAAPARRCRGGHGRRNGFAENGRTTRVTNSIWQSLFSSPKLSGSETAPLLHGVKKVYGVKLECRSYSVNRLASTC